MSETAAAGHSPAFPKTLQPASLLKRAAVGLLALVLGIMIGAWLLHSSIQTTDAAQSGQSVSSAQHVLSKKN